MAGCFSQCSIITKRSYGPPLGEGRPVAALFLGRFADAEAMRGKSLPHMARIRGRECDLDVTESGTETAEARAGGSWVAGLCFRHCDIWLCGAAALRGGISCPPRGAGRSGLRTSARDKEFAFTSHFVCRGTNTFESLPDYKECGGLFYYPHGRDGDCGGQGVREIGGVSGINSLRDMLLCGVRPSVGGFPAHREVRAARDLCLVPG